MDFRMNFNQYVKVQLTEYGDQILRDQHEELNLHILKRGGEGIGPYVSRADPEGFTRFQIWDLMWRLGAYIRPFKTEPFKGEMIFLDGEATEQKQPIIQTGKAEG